MTRSRSRSQSRSQTRSPLGPHGRRRSARTTRSQRAIEGDRSGRGFTLTELLVVIAILAIVIALVLAALGKVVDLTRTMRCMGHQRQLAVGWNTYATDNDGRLVSPRSDPFCTQSISTSCGTVRPESYHVGTSNLNIPNQCWVKSWGANMNANGTERRAAIETGKLFPYVGDLAVYRSPNDPSAASVDIDTVQPAGSPKRRIRSYALNAFLGCNVPDDLGSYGGWPCNFNSCDGSLGLDVRSFETLTLSQVPKPGQTFLSIVEDDGVGYNNQGWVIDPLRPRWIDWPAFWRPDAITMANADGSTESYAFTDDNLIQLIETFGHNYTQSPASLCAWEIPEIRADRQDWWFFRQKLLPGVIPGS
jgi:prepilin-type N-terminal cleavage/methylation domain-containing protein